MTDSKYTMVRMKKEVKEVAQRKAAKQNRSMSNYIENLVLNDKS